MTDKDAKLTCDCGLNPAYSIGQSPIALADGESVYYAKFGLNTPKSRVENYAYTPEKLIWEVKDGPVFVYNNNKFKLIQFHFHEKGEHTINMKEYAMELHLVFESRSSELAVIGCMIKHTSETSKSLKAIIEGKSFKIHNPCSYWSYCGSLTSPPYNKPSDISVNWIVSDCILEINTKDMEYLRKLSQTKRELQKRGGRDIIHAKSK